MFNARNKLIYYATIVILLVGILAVRSLARRVDGLRSPAYPIAACCSTRLSDRPNVSP